MKKRHSKGQIIRILREAERNETSVREVCRQHPITEQTLYRWRHKYGGMEVADTRQGSGIGEHQAQTPGRRADAGDRRLKEFSRKK
jgi:putative transposase